MSSNKWKTMVGVGAWAIGAMLFYPLAVCAESVAPHHYSVEDMSGEPPITQQDIDAYSKLAVGSQYATLGLSHKRFYFLMGKFPLVTQAAFDQELQGYSGLPDSFKPSSKEIALVEKNWKKFYPEAPSLEKVREFYRSVRESRIADEKSFRENVKKEPPLTQADVDAWLNFEEGFDAMYADLAKGGEAVRNKVQALRKATGLNFFRQMYLSRKIWRFAQPLLNLKSIAPYGSVRWPGLTGIDDGTQLSAEEAALLRRNQDKIVTVYKTMRAYQDQAEVLQKR